MPMPALLTHPASGASSLRARGPVQVRRPFSHVPANDGAAARDGGFDLRGELLVELDADDEPAVGEQAVEAGAADPLPRTGDDNASIHHGSLEWVGNSAGVLRIGNEPPVAGLVGPGQRRRDRTDAAATAAASATCGKWHAAA